MGKLCFRCLLFVNVIGTPRQRTHKQYGEYDEGAQVTGIGIVDDHAVLFVKPSYFIADPDLVPGRAFEHEFEMVSLFRDPDDI